MVAVFASIAATAIDGTGVCTDGRRPGRRSYWREDESSAGGRDVRPTSAESCDASIAPCGCLWV